MNNRIMGIRFMDVSIENGFWSNRQKINSETTIYALLERFRETGRLDALNFKWKEGDPKRPHMGWDSDIAKWVESASNILVKKTDGTLENVIDDIVDLIESSVVK